MDYYRLQNDVSVPGRWYLLDPEVEGVEPFQFWGGQPVQVPGPPRLVIHVPGRALDFDFAVEPVPVARARLAEAVARAAGRDVQRIPARVEGIDDPYEILNAVRLVDCLDERSSTFTKWKESDGRQDRMGEYRSVAKLRVDPTRIPPDAAFFRLRGWVVALIVSRPVKEAMEAAGCLGAKFESVS